MAKWIRYTYIASQVAVVVKNPPADAGDTRDVGSIPGLGRSPGVGIGKLLQYLCLENSMNREEFLVLYNQFHQLSILYLVVYVCQYSNLPIHPTSPYPTSFLVSVSLFSTSVSLFLLCKKIIYTIFSLILHLCLVVVQSLNCVWLFATPWTAAHQASLSTNSQSLLKFMFFVFFALQKALSLIRYHLFIFIFIYITLEGGSKKKILLWFMLKSVLPMFSSRNFIVSGLTSFWSTSYLVFNPFWVCFCVKKCFNFILLHIAEKFSQHYLLKRVYLLHYIFLPPLSKIRCP